MSETQTTSSYEAQFLPCNTLIVWRKSRRSQAHLSFRVTSLAQWMGTHADTAGACGAKELAKHGKGCPGPMGQDGPPCLRTQSLTHTHLGSSPTHLHKGQSLWQPQKLLYNLGTRIHCQLNASLTCRSHSPIRLSPFMQVIFRNPIQHLCHLNQDRISIQRDSPLINSTCKSPWSSGRASLVVTAHTGVFLMSQSV